MRDGGAAPQWSPRRAARARRAASCETALRAKRAGPVGPSRGGGDTETGPAARAAGPVSISGSERGYRRVQITMTPQSAPRRLYSAGAVDELR